MGGLALAQAQFGNSCKRGKKMRKTLKRKTIFCRSRLTAEIGQHMYARKKSDRNAGISGVGKHMAEILKQLTAIFSIKRSQK